MASAGPDIAAALAGRGRVEYTLGGDFGAGVGVVGHADDAEMEMAFLEYLKMGDGPDYFFFRPYHLVHFEAPITIAEAVVDRAGLGRPTDQRVAETITIAKQDLAAGTALDGIGGAWSYGWIDTADAAAGLLNMGLSEHATLTRQLGVDEPIGLDDVELDDSALIVRLRAEQDLLLAG